MHGWNSSGTVWSTMSATTSINPDSSVALSGASNTRTACVSHSALYGDPTIYGQVREFVR